MIDGIIESMVIAHTCWPVSDPVMGCGYCVVWSDVFRGQVTYLKAFLGRGEGEEGRRRRRRRRGEIFLK